LCGTFLRFEGLSGKLANATGEGGADCLVGQVALSWGVKILHLYLSPDHNYFGHYGKPPGENPILEFDELECVAGSGIRNDRFFDYKPDYKGQITFFEIETHRALCSHFGLAGKTPEHYRRNVVVEGRDLNALIGEEFEIQGIRFLGTEEAKPCFWMDQALCPGAEEFLKGRGGLRAKILDNGLLRRDARPQR
jgi:hypothetical protein